MNGWLGGMKSRQCAASHSKILERSPMRRMVHEHNHYACAVVFNVQISFWLILIKHLPISWGSYDSVIFTKNRVYRFPFVNRTGSVCSLSYCYWCITNISVSNCFILIAIAPWVQSGASHLHFICPVLKFVTLTSLHHLFILYLLLPFS